MKASMKYFTTVNLRRLQYQLNLTVKQKLEHTVVLTKTDQETELEL